jgi:hypothetical protein
MQQDLHKQPGSTMCLQVAKHCWHTQLSLTHVLGWLPLPACLQRVNLGFHFDVEQRARSFMGWFFNFNGTAGVWRIEVGRGHVQACWVVRHMTLTATCQATCKQLGVGRGHVQAMHALCRQAAADVYIQ